MTKEQLEAKKLKLERIMQFLKVRIVDIDNKEREKFMFRRMELMFKKLEKVNKRLHSM
jgi:hypothetical protein